MHLYIEDSHEESLLCIDGYEQGLGFRDCRKSAVIVTVKFEFFAEVDSRVPHELKVTGSMLSLLYEGTALIENKKLVNSREFYDAKTGNPLKFVLAPEILYVELLFLKFLLDFVKSVFFYLSYAFS